MLLEHPKTPPNTHQHHQTFRKIATRMHANTHLAMNLKLQQSSWFSITIKYKMKMKVNTKLNAMISINEVCSLKLQSTDGL